MNIKRLLITVAVTILAEKTDLIQKTDPSTEFINSLFGIENQEERTINEIDRLTGKAADAAKKIKLNRDFKKVTQNF